MSKPKLISQHNTKAAFPHPTHTCLPLPYLLKGRKVMVVADEDVAKAYPSPPAFAWIYDITEHYPPTLATWRGRFFDAWERLRGLGYDERFRRLWDFYLSSSEAGFRERRIGDVQLLFAKPGAR